MKLLISVISALILFFMTGCTAKPEPTSQTLPPFPADAVEIGTSGYYCITGESEAVDVIGSEDTQRVQVFAHQVFDPQGEYIVTLTATVTGEHSPEEDTAAVTRISASLTNAAIEGVTTSEHISKNTATVVLYWNQTSICHFQYRLYPDGTLEFLS